MFFTVYAASLGLEFLGSQNFLDGFMFKSVVHLIALFWSINSHFMYFLALCLHTVITYKQNGYTNPW